MKRIATFSGKRKVKSFKNTLAKLLLVFTLLGYTTFFGQTKTTVTSAGTTSFTAPTGVTSVTVQTWGSGGAGGGSNLNKKAASGGGGGAYNFSNAITVTPGTTYTNSVVVGAGGTGVLGATGTNGNASSVIFGSSLSANGGKGGTANGTNTSPAGDGGAAGTFAGGNGGSATQGVNGPGGGGGSSAGTAAAGNNGTATAAGAAVTGGGAGGAQGAQSVDGSAGSSPGGGGGGGGDKAGSNTTTGGAGAAGQVIISYFLLTNTSNVTVCNGTTATITVSGTTTNLPVGSYTVIYDLSSPNASTNNSTSMTVSTAGTATFTTVTLSNTGATTITITSISSTIGGVAYKTTYNTTGNANNKSTITVSANNTVGAASSTPTLCINIALTAITHATTGATGIGTATGLPAGVTAAWSANVITISGTPTASGTFNYSIPLTGGCGSVNATGTITVTPANTAGAASSSPTLCINTALTAITHTTTGASGIGTATGLPAGVTSAWASNTITISGTPTASGTFNYSIPLTGGCGSVNATGTITVTAVNTAGAASSSPTLCINTALTAITHATTGATGIGTATGLPSGVTAAWASNTITISGTPTASGTFNYSIPLTGGCGSVNATGTITVTPANTVGVASSSPTLCINTALTAITHTTTGATGIGTATGLPAGVTAAWASNTITVSGTPTASGTFNYSIPLTGGCGSVNATGTITVRAASTAAVISGTASICSGSSTNLQVAITGGTSPFTVVYTTGSVSSYITGSNISVSPTSTTTYTITSVTDANGCLGTGNSGSAVVTITTTTTTDGGTTWNNGTPTNTKAAIYDGSTGTISADLSACSLRLTNNAVVTVSSGFDVTLNGAITIDSGSTFTLSNTANLIQNTTVSNSGNINVIRNSSALKRLDYTLWSSPVAGQRLYAFSKFTLPTRFYVYDTSSNLYSNSVGFSLTGLQYPSPLVSPNGVNGTDSNNVPFATAKGYLIRLPWDHPTTATAWTGTFTGVPNNGNLSFAMSTGYNAVGNPYPSRINVGDFIDGNTNISGPLYLWRKTNDNAATSYATLTKTAYVANGAAGGDTGSGFFNTGDETNWVINIGQGFIVNATSSSNLSFTNSMRRSSNSNQFFKTSQSMTTINNGLYWLNLTTDAGIYSQMAVGYSSDSTLGVDRGIDGKNINQQFYLTSLIGVDEYSIQGRPDFQTDDMVPLSYKVIAAGNYIISIDHTAGLFTGGSQSIYLKDNIANIIHDLNTGAYSFTSATGTFADRFEIIYALPLGVGNPTFTANNVIIYNQNNEFVVNTGNIIMSSIKVFDIRGRLLNERKEINSSQTIINAGLDNEVLLVQITSADGIVVTKKVIQ